MVSICDFINMQWLRFGCNGSFIIGGVWDLGILFGIIIVGDDVEVDVFVLVNVGGMYDIIYDYFNFVEFSIDGFCEECFVMI